MLYENIMVLCLPCHAMPCMHTHVHTYVHNNCGMSSELFFFRKALLFHPYHPLIRECVSVCVCMCMHMLNSLWLCMYVCTYMHAYVCMWKKINFSFLSLITRKRVCVCMLHVEHIIHYNQSWEKIMKNLKIFSFEFF